MAMLLGQTSPRMTVTILPMSQVQISRRLHGSGVNRFGSQQQRAADRAEYGNQAHRLAAYCMLRWGAPTASSAQIATMLLTNPGIGMCMLREDPTGRAQGACTDTSSAQIATMLLTNPGIGMCMLREDPTGRAQGACTDTRDRRGGEYLRALRAPADLDYAHALKIGDVPWLSPDGHSAVTIAADRRYLHDVSARPRRLAAGRGAPRRPHGGVPAERPRPLRPRGAHARAYGGTGPRDELAHAADHGD